MESNCRGCGSVLDLTDEQIRQAVDEDDRYLIAEKARIIEDYDQVSP